MFVDNLSQEFIDEIKKRVIGAELIPGQTITGIASDGMFFQFVVPKKQPKPWKRYKRKPK